MKLQLELEIKQILQQASSVFIMGHTDLDLDALGASLGMCYILHKYNPKIIIDDDSHELGVAKILKNIPNNVAVVKSHDVINCIDEKSVLFLVDTNKISLAQNPKFAQLVPNIIVIDHHGISADTLDTKYLFVEKTASSTCEMLTLYLAKKENAIPESISIALLAGILLDTNNFVLKTTADTYYAAYYLAKCGAKNIDVQYLLKQDLKEYIKRQHVITDVQIKNKIAITTGDSNIRYRREDLAKIADTLIMFNDIEASFVVGNLKGKDVGISSRSIGNINVGKILEQLGGGGDKHEAAARFTNTTIEDVFEQVMKLIN